MRKAPSRLRLRRRSALRVPATALPGTKPSLCKGDVPQMAPNSSCETVGRRDRPLWSADDLHNPGLVPFSSIDSYITGVWCHSLASSFTQREFGANHGRRFLRNSDLVPSGPPMLGLPTGRFAIGPGPAAGPGLLQNAGGPAVVPRALPSRSRSVRAGATCLSRSPYPSGWWQATMCPPPRSRSSGLSCLQTSVQ